MMDVIIDICIGSNSVSERMVKNSGTEENLGLECESGFLRDLTLSSIMQLARRYAPSQDRTLCPLCPVRSIPLHDSSEEKQPTDIAYPTEPIVIDDVRISPSHILFQNAYDGKHFTACITIQNCGKHSSFIRIGVPNSSSFEMEALTQGQQLSPGLRLTRTVKYMYRAALQVLQGFVLIYINEEVVKYHFLVTLAVAVLSLEPPQLDFGRSDAVNSATKRRLLIHNSGYKGTQFAIDLGRNKLELIVEPLKGQIPARSTVVLNVEIVGSSEGSFIEEFWIKSKPPLRVIVFGAFIAPKLMVRKLVSGLDITLLQFPPTFYNARSTLPLFIKNFSSSHCMFCVLADIQGVSMTLDEARLIDDTYKNFVIHPSDGRMQALKGSIIQITFTPTRTRKKDKDYVACFLRVVRMDCKDVPKITEEEDLEEVPQNELFASSASSSSLTDVKELSSDLETYYDESSGSPTPNFSFEHVIGVCLYGDKVTLDISLLPDTITLSELQLLETNSRTILVRNNSKRLPVKICYQKVVSVNVKPAVFVLDPGHSHEVQVVIRSFKMGKSTSKIPFELHSYDVLSKMSYRVGTVSVLLCYETTKVQRTPEARCGCAPFDEGIAPNLQFKLCPEEIEWKLNHDSKYLAYIRSLLKPHIESKAEKLLRDYELTQKKLLLRKTYSCQRGPTLVPAVASLTPFIPLPPYLLHNIKIFPKSIRLRKVATFTTITNFMRIENLNQFPIHVHLKPSKSCINFFSNSRYVINAKEKRKIEFQFTSNLTGKYHISISVIINSSTLFEVTAVAEVVRKTLKLDPGEIEFGANTRRFAFFKVVNKLNSFTSFDWELPESCFRIYPMEGVIPAESCMLSMVSFHNNDTQQYSNEAILSSESGQQTLLKLKAKNIHHCVVFDRYKIDLGVISLNVETCTKFVLRNLATHDTFYTLSKSEDIPGLSITPSEGILNAASTQVFLVTILMTVPLSFTTSAVFTINNEFREEVTLTGVVEYPRIALSPKMLQFRKIAPYSYDCLAFTVQNCSELCEVSVQFPFTDFPEFSITDTDAVQFPHQEQLMLQPKETRVLFLHFHPAYISTFLFLLPYIVNGVLGPVFLSSAVSLNPHYFLQDSAKYAAVKGVTLAGNIPPTMPSLRINCTAIDKSLEFNSLKINFLYFGADHYHNKLVADFEVSNTGTEKIEVCLRTDAINGPFGLVPKPGMEFQAVDGISFVFSLEMQQMFAFDASFYPVGLELGRFQDKVPIFLRGYPDNIIFNYLVLSGECRVASIVPSRQSICFNPAPLRVLSQVRITLSLTDHVDGCEISADTDLAGVSVSLPRSQTITGDVSIPVLISFASDVPLVVTGVVTFTCLCQASCQIVVTGVAENCLLTNHAVFQIIKAPAGARTLVSETDLLRSLQGSKIDEDSSSFPLFPDDEDLSSYALYMRSIVKSVENWVYSQGFYRKHYYRIPEGFSDFCKVNKKQEKMRFGGHKKPIYVELPLLELMMNLAGDQIRPNVATNAPTTDNEKEWMLYTFNVNCNILRWFSNFPLNIPNVKAKYLLNYQQYTEFEKLQPSDTPTLNEKLFNRLSKQCWLDLLLQIIKVFVFLRTIPVTDDRRSMNVDHIPEDYLAKPRTSELSKDCLLSMFTMAYYSNQELILLDWLEECYEAERLDLWGAKTSPKPLHFFDHDLRDGLVLGTAIAHYCPYVKDQVKTMYYAPKTPEEVFHNSCTLVHLFQVLSFSYELWPFSIQKGQPLELLLLVLYLYSILPSYCPKDLVTIEAPLTQTSSNTIELYNKGDYPVFYQAIFFGNDHELLSLVATRIQIEPLSKKNVKVKYHAKYVFKISVTLVFSGETPGSKYSKSLAFRLEGNPDVSFVCMEIPLKVKLYCPCEAPLTITSPFKVPAKYSVLCGYVPANNGIKLLYPWDVIKGLKIAHEFYIETSDLECDVTGSCQITILLCAFKPSVKNLWLYFSNPEIGDWAVKLIITGVPSEASYEPLTVILPEKQCRCKGKIKLTGQCPKIMKVEIDCKNQFLWSARKLMMLHYVTGPELRFWAKRFLTPTGHRILALMLNSERHPMRQRVEETIRYKVVVPEESPILAVESITIEDITAEGTCSLLVHERKEIKDGAMAILRLEAEDQSEVRFYKLKFVKPGTDLDSMVIDKGE